MNLIDIVKNAPEGATHYGTNSDGKVKSYYKKHGDSSWSYSPTPVKKGWDKLHGSTAYPPIPLPKLKTEYRKVEYSIWDLQLDFEAGELYHKLSNDYEPILNIQTLALAVVSESCFYRSEKIINEREEFKYKMDATRKEWFASGCNETIEDFLFENGLRFID